MKKLFTLLLSLVFGATFCFPQTADSGYVDPEPGCRTYFYYYFNDSIKTFVEAYPYNFVDQTGSDVVKWYWDFGDGKTSDERNPLHFYSTAGDSVLVCLTTTRTDGCESSFCIGFVVGRPLTPPECNIDFTIAIGESFPPVYQFIPDTLKDKASYFWDFGDSTFSTEIRPSHRYEFGGNYQVCLNVITEDNCSAYACKMLQAIGYSNECKAAWTAYSDVLMGPDGTVTNDSSYSPLGRYYYFQDQSRGAVIQWKWDFGDGAGSKEQYPVHVYAENGIYTVCLEILTADSCTSSFCDTLYVGMVPYCSLTGSVKDYTGLDGCGLLIVLDNGEVLEPVEIVPNFVLKNGQRVRLAYTELTDRASICMAGKIVRIDCIEELTVDSCLASFSHYPIPWISSLPPLYQFEDLSSGEVVDRIWDFGDGTVTKEVSPTHRYEYSGYYSVCLTIFTSGNCSSSVCETAFYEGANPQPGLCDFYIKLNTEIILNGQTCNGSAVAGLVDLEGNDAYAAEFLWSTGETGPSINNLCPGMTYSVIITDATGCAVSGSFSFGGNVVFPDSLFGNWNFEQENMNFMFNIPVFSDSIYCEWDFGDGSTAAGSSVSHTYSSDDAYTVVLNVFDLKGNLLYNQQIPVTPGAPTGIKKPIRIAPHVYPVPATDVLYLKSETPFEGTEMIEVFSSGGQSVLGVNGIKVDNNLLHLDVSDLPPGFYMGKLIYRNGLIQSFRFIK